MQSTDAELLGAFLADADDNAFQRIVERHSQMVYSTCLRGLNGDEALAKDACQAVFVLLVRKGRSLRRRQALSSWLRRTASSVVKNLVREHSRRRKREQTAIEIQAVDAPEAPVGESREKLLLQAIEQLPTKYREPLQLHYLDGLKLRDVGEAIGCSEDAARKRVKASLQQLRRVIMESGSVLSLAVILSMLVQLVAKDRIAGIVQSSFRAAMETAGHAAGSLASLPSHLIAEGVEAMWFQQRVRKVIAGAAAILALALIPLAVSYAQPSPSTVSPTESAFLPPDRVGPIELIADPTPLPPAEESKQSAQPTETPELLPALDVDLIYRDDFKDASGWLAYGGRSRPTTYVDMKDMVNLQCTDVGFKGKKISALKIDQRKLKSPVMLVVCKRMFVEPDYRAEFDLRLEGYQKGKAPKGFGLSGIQCWDLAPEAYRDVTFSKKLYPAKMATNRKWLHVRIDVHSLQGVDSRASTRYDIFVNGEWFQTAYCRNLTSPQITPVLTAGCILHLANFRVRRIPPLPLKDLKIPGPK